MKTKSFLVVLWQRQLQAKWLSPGAVRCTYALGAGTLFTDQIQTGKTSQYIFTILSQAVDKYIQEWN